VREVGSLGRLNFKVHTFKNLCVSFLIIVSLYLQNQEIVSAG